MSDYKLTQEDLRMIAYSWTEWGNLERWASWEKAKPAVASEYPEIVKAWNDYKASMRILDAVVKNLPV